MEPTETLTDTLLGMVRCHPSTPEELAARLKFVQDLLCEKVEHEEVKLVATIRKKYGVAFSTAVSYISRARKALGETMELPEEQFTGTFLERMLSIAFNPRASHRDQIRAMEALAKCRLLARAVDKPSTTANLQDPAVLEAALALDAAIEKAKEPCSTSSTVSSQQS